MLGPETRQARPKLLARRRAGWTPAAPKQTPRRGGRARPPRALVETALAITSSCDAAIAGLELCAHRTRDHTIAVAASSAADFLRALVDATISAAEERGIDARVRARTCDRLRWEWLASTATVVDGTPDGRLLTECARVLSDALTAANRVEDLGDGIAARLRVASAEAYSLASALRYRRRGELALALV